MIAVMDLDHFKQFNDTLGHAAGDQLLQDLAVSWRSQLREGDLLARVGGDEFCLLLPNPSAEDERNVLARLQAAMPAGRSCSVGVAVWDGAEDAASLFARADHALYASRGQSIRRP